MRTITSRPQKGITIPIDASALALIRQELQTIQEELEHLPTLGTVQIGTNTPIGYFVLCDNNKHTELVSRILTALELINAGTDI